VFAEKNLNRKNDRERHNTHRSKRDRDQPYAAAPPKNGTAAIQGARPEKPATQNDENEEQHHGLYNPYSDGLVEREHVIKNDKYEHNDGEKETGLPLHPVAKKTCGDLHKPAYVTKPTAMKMSRGTIISLVLDCRLQSISYPLEGTPVKRLQDSRPHFARLEIAQTA